MRHIDRASALVFSGSGALAALIPALFVARIHGHHLHGLVHRMLPGLVG